MVNSAAAARRALPSVDRLLGSAAVEPLIAAYGRTRVTEALRRALDTERARLAQPAATPYDDDRFMQTCAAALAAAVAPSLIPVFNLTGTVLHTNLGRAVMPQSAADAVMAAMTRPVNLEFDLASGARGERDSHVEKWLRELGGEGAYSGGFIEHYLIALIYPEGLTRNIQLLIGAGVLAINAAIYLKLWQRRRAQSGAG